ncbi:unnamed protein product [Brassica napus]|uniref:(rape) hypothetical protein n=1 Tax=Brassica napus TaxID=3708 RepID=A0A816J4I2_BRANA|nr:unnamed protein product [Brassica napus]
MGVDMLSLMPRILLKKKNLIHAQRSGYSVLILTYCKEIGRVFTVSQQAQIYFVFVSSGDSFEKKRNRVLLVRWEIGSEVRREGAEGFNETITKQ